MQQIFLEEKHVNKRASVFMPRKRDTDDKIDIEAIFSTNEGPLPSNRAIETENKENKKL